MGGAALLIDKPYKSRTFVHKEIVGYLCDFYGFYLLGREGLATLIERNCQYAARFAEGLTAAGFPILNEVSLNQVLVSFGDDATTRRIISAIQAEGTCWAGATTWQGRAAMRISVSSWATTEADVAQSLAAIIRVADRTV